MPATNQRPSLRHSAQCCDGSGSSPPKCKWLLQMPGFCKGYDCCVLLIIFLYTFAMGHALVAKCCLNQDSCQGAPNFCQLVSERQAARCCPDFDKRRRKALICRGELDDGWAPDKLVNPMSRRHSQRDIHLPSFLRSEP